MPDVTRRLFLTGAGGGIAAATALMANPLSAVLVAGREDWNSSCDLCSRAAIRILNRDLRPDANAIADAEGIVVAGSGRQIFPQIPREKPIYWMSPLPAEPAAVIRALRLRKQEVRFADPAQSCAVLSAFCDAALAIVAVRAFAYGVRPDGRDALTQQLSRIAAVTGIDFHSCRPHVSIDRRARFARAKSPHSPDFHWLVDMAPRESAFLEQYVTGDGVFEMRFNGGQTSCSFTPAPGRGIPTTRYSDLLMNLNRIASASSAAREHLFQWALDVRKMHPAPRMERLPDYPEMLLFCESVLKGPA